jgi:peroxiredoxin
MNKYFIYAITLLVFTACGDSDQSDSDFAGYTVSGQIANAANETIYLEEVVGQSVNPIDTIQLDENGSFKAQGRVQESGIYTMAVKQVRNIMLYVENGSNIVIEGDSKANKYFVAQHSKSKSMNVFFKSVNDQRQAMQNIPQQFNAAASQPGADQMALRREYEARFNSIQTSLNGYIATFIDTADPLMGIFATNLIDANENYELLKGFADRLMAEMPDNKYAAPFIAKIESIKTTQVGAIAPEIVLPDPNGENRSLSSLRGKVVLVDFWASWCRPCRVENPNLVNAYQQFNDKGFEIYSVSLDQQKAMWVQAIKDDKLEWAEHVSELVTQRWKDKVMQSYNFNSIPTSYLLGPDGEILAKNLRGPALVEKLYEVLGES